MLFVNWLAYFCTVTIFQLVDDIACKLHGSCRFHHLYQNSALSHFNAAKSCYLHNRKLIQFHIYRDPTVMLKNKKHQVAYMGQVKVTNI
jgi:hypothetical protein